MATYQSQDEPILSGKSKTYGWDAIVINNAQAVNTLFAQQFVENMATGNGQTGVSATISSTGLTIQFNDIVFGPPLIAFAPNSAPQDALVTLPLLSGEVIMTNTAGEFQYVAGAQLIAPACGYGIQITVPLSSVSGQIVQPSTQQPVQAQLVQVELNNAGNYAANLVSNASGASYLGDHLYALYTGEAAQLSTYTLGSLVFGSSENLTPTSFEIRTQAGSGSDAGGNVLLFVATTYNPNAGVIPGSNFPDLLFGSYTCAVLVASRTLFGNILAPAYTASLKQAPSISVQNGGSLPSAAASLVFSGALSIPGFRIDMTSGQLWTGDNGFGQPESVSLSYSGLGISPENDLLTLQWTNSYSVPFSGEIVVGGNPMPTGGSVNITIHSTASLAPSVNSQGLVSFNGSPSTSISFEHTKWYDKIVHGSAQDEMGSSFTSAIQPLVQAIVGIPLPEINTFAIDHLLFPSMNALTFAEAHLPGDLALFGKIAPTENVFQIQPMQQVVPSGGSFQFQTTNDGTAAWNINVGSSTGAINTTTGFFTAAPGITTPTSVVVTATSGENKSVAIVTVVPPGVIVSPSYVVVSPNTSPQKFVAGCEGGTAIWSISPDDGSAGTIDATTGTYTPPATFPTGVTTATITASCAGQTGTALIVLFGANGTIAVSPLSTLLGSGEQNEFTTSSSSEWVLLPTGLGQLSVASGASNKICTYTAPTDIEAPAAAVLVAQMPGHAKYVGMAMIQLTPSSD